MFKVNLSTLQIKEEKKFHHDSLYLLKYNIGLISAWKTPTTQIKIQYQSFNLFVTI